MSNQHVTFYKSIILVLCSVRSLAYVLLVLLIPSIFSVFHVDLFYLFINFVEELVITIIKN